MYAARAHIVCFAPVTSLQVIAASGERLTPAELAQRLLADYKVPRQFVFADALPTTPAGKIAKADLRTQYEAD